MTNETFENAMTVLMCIFVFFVGAFIGVVARDAVLKHRAESKSANSIYDLNLDGKLNSYDGDICYDIFLGERVATPAMLERADVTKDGLVDDADVVAIMDAVLGKVEK